ncbi:MAG: radical SAM protein [Patescibacteria group bacterium]|nr:radical SAM protein [Patescibacteria group bacterium]
MLYRALYTPLGVQIELTTKCSNNCPHCYNYQRQDDDPDTTMSIEQLRVTFDALAKAKIFYVTLTGGEPQLFPDLLVEGIRLCAEKEFSCSINTNLTVMSEKLILRMKRAGRFTILTSLASCKEKVHDTMMGREGSFRRTLKGIELLRKNGVGFSANMVITQQNADHVYETGLFAHQLGAKSFSATKASPPLRCIDYSGIQPSRDQVKCSLEDLLRLEKETGIQVDILESYPLCLIGDTVRYAKFARRRCSAGILSGTVGPDGQVRPCSHSNRTYGNILEDDLAVIYSRMNEWRTGELLPEKCLLCEHFAICSGGCRCEAEHASTIRGMDPFATNSDDVILPQEEATNGFEIMGTTLFSVEPDVKFREEEFGYVLRRKRSVTMVGKEAGLLLKELQKTAMTLEEAAHFSHADTEKVAVVLKGLSWKKIVSHG